MQRESEHKVLWDLIFYLSAQRNQNHRICIIYSTENLQPARRSRSCDKSHFETTAKQSCFPAGIVDSAHTDVHSWLNATLIQQPATQVSDLTTTFIRCNLKT